MQLKAPWFANLKNTIGRGVFPHQMSFFLDLPWRKFLLRPDELVARLTLRPTDHVLEVGAGSGFYGVAVARRLVEGRLDMVDLQPEMLKKARYKVEAERLLNVGYAAANASNLPLRANAIQCIYMVAVFGEISDRRSFLREARRVLEPGGILSISEHLPDPDFLRFATIKSLVEEEHFQFVKHYGGRWSYTATFAKSSS